MTKESIPNKSHRRYRGTWSLKRGRPVFDSYSPQDAPVEFTGYTTNDASANSPLLRIRENVTVELDRPTVIGRIDDPDSDRSFTIELTATRIKDKS